MNIRRYGSALLFLPAFLACLASSGQAATQKPAEDKLILTVNGDKITAQDLQRELHFRSKQDPSFKATPEASQQQLETMINRRVMIQEAVKRRLAQEEIFVHTIRNFWEQTLIRNLLSQISAEIEKSIKISDAEVQQFYSKLSEKVTFEVAMNTDRKTVEELAQKLKDGKTIMWNEKLGPAVFTELASPALEDAFSMPVGGWKVYFEKDLYYLIRVAAREAVVTPALEEARGQIRETLKQRKIRDGLEAWLHKKRTEAKIVLPVKTPEKK